MRKPSAHALTGRNVILAVAGYTKTLFTYDLKFDNKLCKTPGTHGSDANNLLPLRKYPTLIPSRLSPKTWVHS